MRKILKRLWNEPVAFAGAAEAAVLIPDLPGPRWAWGLVAAAFVVGARQVVDGPVTKAERS